MRRDGSFQERKPSIVPDNKPPVLQNIGGVIIEDIGLDDAEDDRCKQRNDRISRPEDRIEDELPSDSSSSTKLPQERIIHTDSVTNLDERIS